MARRTGWTARVAGGAAGFLLALPAGISVPEAWAADGFADHAPEIIADLQAMRDPVLFEHDGYDLAEDAGGHVVTLHKVRFAPLPAGYADAGEVRLRFVAEAAGYRLDDIDLPSDMALRTPDGAREIGTVRITDYDLTGHWSTAERDFLSFEGHAGELYLEDREAQTVVAASSLRSSFIDSPDGAGRWREVGEMEIEGLSMRAKDAGTVFGRLTGHWSIDQMDREQAAALDRLFSAALQQADGLMGEQPPPDMAALRDLDMPFGRARFDLDIADMRIDEVGGESSAVGHVRFEMSGADLDQGLSTLRLRLALDGIDAGLPGGVPAGLDSPGLDSALAPRAVDLSLGIDNLPGRDVWNALLDSVVPGPESGETAHQETMMRLALALQAAGTRLRFDTARLVAPSAELFADGMVQAHAPAALGAVMAVTIDVVGFDALSALAREPGSSGEAAAGLGELVAWLDHYGKAATAPSGEASRRLDIVVDGTGLLTVNGRELPLFGTPPGEMEN